MADIKVKDLADTSSIALDNQIMVLTNDARNQVQNITVENLLTNVMSSDNGNVLEQGTDGKLYVENPENITGELADLATTDKTTLVAAINEVDSDITAEVTTRANADNNLQTQIDAITAASDVTDIVGTYAQLQAYDTTGLPDNSIIKVLQDESRQNETTYYRWVITGGVGAWILIGEEGPYYTKSQADSLFATQQTTGNLAFLDTSDKTSLVNAINELSSVLDPTQTADYINNSKAVESGSVSSNSIILADVTKYAHSTFDLSKFTVVGTPIINDSMLSGITSANYLTLPSINFGTSFTVISPIFKLNRNVEYTECLVETDQFAIQVRQNKVYCWRYTTNKNNYDLLEGTTTLELNTDYIIKYEQIYNGTTYTINAYLSTDYGETWNLERTLTRTYGTYYNYGLIYIGRRENAAYPNLFVSGALDLKAFACFNEGLSVFNASKNGVDVISPDNFTVVGIPALSNGILDGITSGNYLTAPAIDLGDNFEIISPLFKATGLLTPECILETDEIAIQIRDGKTYCWRYTTNKNTFDLLEGVTTLELGKYYLIKYTQTFDGTNYTLTTYLSNDFGATWTLERTLTRTEASYYNGGLIYFGRRQNAGYPNLFSNPLNLNHCKISSSKGDKYYPCVYIPYSESNTGSKIADFTYRLPVQYAYEMNGIAPYYTLDEISRNFSLPMGELYGMINKLKNSVTSMVMPDYENQILSASSVAPNTYIQCNYNSFVVLWGNDPYTVDAAGWVSPDNGVTKYRIGFFYSDLNANTKGTSFSFFVPKGWYFTSEFENNFNYAIYPLKGEV